jgi:hypothetical protein
VRVARMKNEKKGKKKYYSFEKEKKFITLLLRVFGIIQFNTREKLLKKKKKKKNFCKNIYFQGIFKEKTKALKYQHETFSCN